MNHHLITLMVLLPFLGALTQAFFPSNEKLRVTVVAIAKQVALASSVLASLCAVVLVVSMQAGTSELQANEVLPWVGSYAISYDVGIDGLSALLVLLVAIVFPVLIAAEWNQKVGARGMHALFLVLQSSFFGALCAQDLFLLFFFWALSSFPFYFLIGIWGGGGRERAAFRSIVSLMAGNGMLFAALVLVYYSVDPHTFSLRELVGGRLAGKTISFLGLDIHVAAVAFGLVCGGLALRAPVWPFHGWFTQVSEEVPASVFVALSAVSTPVTAAIFSRLVYSLFPETVAAAAPGIVLVGAVNLAIGGACAAAQRDLRRLLAFVCLSETGLILMGIGSLNPAGAVGAVFQQFALGLGLAGFGLFSGILQERFGIGLFGEGEDRRKLSGIVMRAPLMAIVAAVFIASLLGFPGAGGFVGKSLLVIGSYSAHPVVVSVIGIAYIIATYCLLSMYRHVFLGRRSEADGEGAFVDLTLREKAYLLPVVAGVVVFGLYPRPLLEVVRPTVLTLLSLLH